MWTSEVTLLVIERVSIYITHLKFVLPTHNTLFLDGCAADSQYSILGWCMGKSKRFLHIIID